MPGVRLDRLRQVAPADVEAVRIAPGGDAVAGDRADARVDGVRAAGQPRQGDGDRHGRSLQLLVRPEDPGLGEGRGSSRARTRSGSRRGRAARRRTASGRTRASRPRSARSRKGLQARRARPGRRSDRAWTLPVTASAARQRASKAGDTHRLEVFGRSPAAAVPQKGDSRRAAASTSASAPARPGDLERRRQAVLGRAARQRERRPAERRERIREADQLLADVEIARPAAVQRRRARSAASASARGRARRARPRPARGTRPAAARRARPRSRAPRGSARP